jgi:hypothetical protein
MASGSQNPKAKFLGLVVEIGLVRAAELLRDVRATFGAVASVGGEPAPPASAGADAASATRIAKTSPTPRAKKSPRRVRTAASTGAVVERILGALKQHAQGLGAEKLRSQLKLSREAVTPALVRALADGRIAKTGQKRGTRYFVAGGSTEAAQGA